MSWNKLKLAEDCEKCFWHDRVKRLYRPGYMDQGGGGHYNDIDRAMKESFDCVRKLLKPHPVMEEHGLDHLVPLAHPIIDDWREQYRGIFALHAPSGIAFYGIPDDVWFDIRTGCIHIVEYKSTHMGGTASLDEPWKQKTYTKQAEAYAWILLQWGMPVSRKSFFVFGQDEGESTHDDPFSITKKVRMRIVEHDLDCSWVHWDLLRARAVLRNPEPPEGREHCPFCKYGDTHRMMYGGLESTEEMRKRWAGM